MGDSVFQLAYGRDRIEVNLSQEEVLGVLQPRGLSPLPDPEEKIRAGLGRPLESPPLRELAKAGQSVAIIASDITRVTRSEMFLPILVEELNRAGVADQDITIIFAQGIHRPHTPQEQHQLVGDSLVGRIKLLDHDARDPEANVYLGTTRRGTRVAINRAVAAADLVILTGNITYHYFAGFTGGRKALVPGVAAGETISQNHNLVLNPEPGSGINPAAISGKLEGNPVHEDLVEGAALAHPDFLLNLVVDDHRQVAGAFAGDWLAAHEQGARFMDEHYRVEIPKPADLVIVSCGGSPRDINLIQSHKAIDDAFPAVREGGVMIVLAECADGIGSDHFHQWSCLGSLEAIEAKLRQNYQVHGQTCHACMRKALQAQIIMVSSLPDQVVEKTKMIPAPDIDSALSLAREKLGSGSSAYVIPEGYTIRICPQE